MPAGLPHVRADLDRAVQVLSNVLTNALRYTPAPGTVLLTVRAASGAVQFSVCDSGVGIAADDLTHVFERFYRVDKSRSRALGGSGIGLTIAKALVESMGGRMWADSPGRVGVHLHVHAAHRLSRTRNVRSLSGLIES